MRLFLTIVALLICSCSIHAQHVPVVERSAIHRQASLIHVDLPSQSNIEFLRTRFNDFGLSADDKLSKVNELQSKSGIIHTKYQQEYKGLRVVGAQYILHSRDGQVEKSNGYIAPNLNLNVTPYIDIKEVESLARNFLINQVIGAENHHPSIKVSVHQTKLCIIDKSFPKFSGDYKLAYQTFAQANTSFPIHEKIFIDAKTGTVISNFTEVCDHSVPGKANTKYYGVQDIVTDSIAANTYVLRDSTRGVFTLKGPNGDNSLDLDYPDFYDEDNYWDNANLDFDEVAGDAHYCASSFHDFMDDEFGWKGMDNQGLEMVSVVHASRRFYTNAYWNGDKVFIGNGDCDTYGPLTVLDVVGHEFTHGVIDYSCDLVYQDESGALNESIADILGKSLEYKYDRENFNWLIGNRFRVDEDDEEGFRNMMDPNEERDPKFYNGEYWHYSSSDRGGVHTNSGVFNYWYYLLVEGEEGVNEVGYEYNVEAIGIDDAMQIVFGCMTGYFTESTNYVDAMLLSMEQTADMYGINSQQYASVVEAWMVVGLYPGINNYDLGVEEVDEEYFGCPETEIYPRIIVRNNGLEKYDAGTLVNLRYEFDALTQEVLEDVVLQEDLLPGDSIFHTFSQPIVFENDLKKDVTITVLNEDNLMANNSYEADLEFSPTPGSDLELTQFEFRIDNVCNPMFVDSYKIGYTNDGCMPILAEDSVVLKITTDLEEFTIPYTIYNAIDPGNITISFRNLPEDLEPGFTSFRAEIMFDRDADPSNNVIEGTFEVPIGIEEGYLEEFEEPDYRTQLNVVTSNFSGLDSVVMYKESEMLAITSKRTSFSYEDCMDANDFFDQNSPQSVLSACLDATGMDEPTFGMKIAQLRNGVGATLTESFRAMVKVTNDSLSYPLIYNQENGKVVEHEFDLPVGFIGNFKIEVFVYAGDADAFTEVDLENLDAVLFDRLELFDKADRPDHPSFESYEIYPTLVEDELQVYTPDVDQPYQFIVFDVLGRLVYHDTYSGHQIISLGALPSGSYFYQIRENDFAVEAGKFVRVR